MARPQSNEEYSRHWSQKGRQAHEPGFHHKLAEIELGAKYPEVSGGWSSTNGPFAEWMRSNSTKPIVVKLVPAH